MQNIEKLTKRIQDLVPEIMELKNWHGYENGRPITLEDVLVALWKVKAPHCVSGNTLTLFDDDYSDEPNTFTWLSFNPLHLQSEQLINYLHSILCQKK